MRGRIFKLFKRGKMLVRQSNAPLALPSDELITRGDGLVRAGQNERATALYAQAVETEPHSALAHYKLANAFRNIGRMQEACDCYDRAISIAPDFANAYCNRGVVLALLGRPEAARDSYDRATQFNPSDALAFYNRAAVLRELGDPTLALDSLARAIDINPRYAEAYCSRGIILMELEQWAASESNYDKAININPTFAKAWANRGVLQQKLKRFDAALESYDRAVETDPDDAETHSNRGVLFIELARWSEAMSALERAIALQPKLPEPHFNRGNVFAALRRDERAIESFDRAIELKREYTDAIYCRGNSLAQMGQFEAAVVNYERALALEPKRPFLLGTLLHARMNVCDWSGWQADIEALTAGIRDDVPVSPPLQLMGLVDAPQLLRDAAATWTRHQFPSSDALPAIEARSAEGKIRIAYFSADFHEHPVSILLAEVLKTHDRTTFEVTAFSYGPDVQSEMRRRLENSVHQFIDVRNHSDRSIALLARSHKIDLAIDLMGHTGFGRPGIFAFRAAPLQISWLGFAGTMGADYVDYLIGDRVVTPPSHASSYVENIVRLPGAYLPTDSTRTISAAPLGRCQFGLPPTAFVFCCFNASFKILPDTFEAWMRILDRVEHSVLWLSKTNTAAMRNLRSEAVNRGADPSRLIFADRVPKLADHLARHRLADLFLDTRPYNAHATAIDALWAGLPVLTCRGESFASRVGASLLTAIHMPELITSTPAEYEERAVHLATHPTELSHLRETLVKHRLSTPLFDTPSFTRTLEDAFRQMYRRYRSGLPPQHFDIT